jgi:hypothetical protein
MTLALPFMMKKMYGKRFPTLSSGVAVFKKPYKLPHTLFTAKPSSLSLIQFFQLNHDLQIHPS